MSADKQAERNPCPVICSDADGVVRPAEALVQQWHAFAAGCRPVGSFVCWAGGQMVVPERLAVLAFVREPSWAVMGLTG